MHGKIAPIIHKLDQVIIGKEWQIKLAISCLLANGHLLIEDLPGVGKTTLSHALANVLGLSYQRVQFTSDLLPADLIGVSIFDQPKQEFTFHKGPLFSQVLLADEINRASPKTQSALLESMAEGQISVDGTTYGLPSPFFVIATQNPLDQVGTFRLPDSQLDRFMMRIQLGFPSVAAEKQILQGVGSEVLAREVEQMISKEQLCQLQTEVHNVNVTEPVLDYILALVQESRTNSQYPNPLSPRASKAILIAAKAWAFIHLRDYVLPEDVQAIFGPVAEHRLRNSGQNGGQPLSDALLHSINPLV